jgi:hypothetical protein
VVFAVSICLQAVLQAVRDGLQGVPPGSHFGIIPLRSDTNANYGESICLQYLFIFSRIDAFAFGQVPR